MGAFNTKDSGYLSGIETTTDEENEIYICKESSTNAVSEAILICGPKPADCNKPHGLEVTVDSVSTEMEEEIENSVHGKSFEVVKHTDYGSDYTSTCDKSTNTPYIDKMQPLSKNEKLNSSQSMEETSVLNIMDSLIITEKFTEKCNSKLTVNFHEKVIKKELTDDNMAEEPLFYSHEPEKPESTANKCEWIPNTLSVINTQISVKIKEETDFECKELNEEIIAQNFEVAECKKPLKWVKNPFAAIAAVTRSYGLLMTGRQEDCRTDLHVNDAEMKQESLKCAAENLCLNEINEEAIDNKSCTDSDRLSDFHSLHNTSFESVAQSETAVDTLYKINNGKLHWMVQLPEYKHKPMETQIKQNPIDARLEKKKDKIVAIPKSSKTTLKKRRVCSISKIKVKSKGSKRLRNYARNSQKANKNRAKNRRKRKRVHKFEADKAYNCTASLKSFVANNCCRVLRSKRNEYSKNKHNNTFPKPLDEQKPEIVEPPAPIQIKAVKEDLDINCNEITPHDNMQVAYGATNCSACKIERRSTVGAQKIEVIEEFKKLQDTIKYENKCDDCFSSTTKEVLQNNWQPIVRLKEMKWHANLNAYNISNNIKPARTTNLTTLKQYPGVRIKRLSANQSVNEIKNFEIVKTVEHAVLPTTMLTQDNSKYLCAQIKKELTPECAAKTLFSIDLQQNTKLLHPMLPSVRLQRLPLPKIGSQLQLINTYHIKHECTAMIYNLSKLFKTKQQHHSSTNRQNNCKLLKSLQPKVRLKRLNFPAPLSSAKFNTKVSTKLISVDNTLHLKPVVRVQRLKFNDFKSHRNITYEKVENHTQQLHVDLEVKRERNCYDEKTAYELRKRKKHKVASIKVEKLSPKRDSIAPVTSTPKLRIANAFSMQPIVRLKRLKCAPLSTNVARLLTFDEPETHVKMELMDVAEEQLTPISFAKQYNEQDSGIYSDTTYRQYHSDASVVSFGSDEFSKHEIICEIALQRACINDILLRHGYSPIQFRLYNSLEDLKIFLDYLLVK